MHRAAFVVATVLTTGCDAFFGIGDPRLDAGGDGIPSVGVSHVRTTCKDFIVPIDPTTSTLVLASAASAGNLLVVAGVCDPGPGGSMTFSDDGGNPYSLVGQVSASRDLVVFSSALTQPASSVTGTYLSGCQGPAVICATELARAQPPGPANLKSNSGSGAGDVTIAQPIFAASNDIGYLVVATAMGGTISNPCCTPLWDYPAARDVDVLSATTIVGASDVIAHVDQSWEAIGMVIVSQ